MSNEEDLSLRDKIAMQILQFILSGKEDSTGWTVKDYVNLFDDKDGEKCIKAMERKIRAAYKFADMMRKVRLTTFE